MDINFHIPDFLKHFRLNLVLMTTMRSNPEWFRDGVKIASVYGAFPPSLWNGGRAALGAVDERTIREVLNTYNKDGIPCRFTFTNPVIKEEHLGDPFCNAVMRIADNGLNEVIVNSPLLEDYIRKNYPNYKITSSTCKQIRDFDELCAELGKDYKYVVLDYNFNNKFDILEKLPHKEKCEILINAVCADNCPRRGEHYRFIGEFQRENCNPQMMESIKSGWAKIPEWNCPHMKNTAFTRRKSANHLTVENLYNKYVPMGFTNFKIEGRGNNCVDLVEQYVYFMAKPEYRDVVRYSLLLPVFSSMGSGRRV